MAKRDIPQNEWRRFKRSEEGAALVEFAIVLPMMLLVFAIIIEGSRMLLSYQATIAGVRDAVRYLSRVTPTDICATGGTTAAYNGTLLAMVRGTSSGGTVMPSAVTVNSVTTALSCVSGSYRVSPAPIATVTADITISFPFSGLFTFGGANLAQIRTTVTDNSRVFGT